LTAVLAKGNRFFAFVWNAAKMVTRDTARIHLTIDTISIGCTSKMKPTGILDGRNLENGAQAGFNIGFSW